MNEGDTFILDRDKIDIENEDDFYKVIHESDDHYFCWRESTQEMIKVDIASFDYVQPPDYIVNSSMLTETESTA